jgi:membrane protease YdiL (CAAX protease family)
MLAIILIAGMVATLAAGAILAWRYRHGLFPPLRRRLVSWELADILISFVLILLIPLLVLAILKSRGFYLWWYGENPSKENEALLARCTLWAYCIGFPFALLAVLGWLALRGTRPWQMGLTKWRFAPSLATGSMAWWLLTPAAFLINVTVNWFYIDVLKTQPAHHPLQKLGMGEAGSMEWALIAFIAVVKAPFEEELLFRGLLLPWLAERWWSAPLAWSAALIIAGLMGPGWLPVIYSGVVGLPLLLVCVRQDILPTPLLAIYGSSLLFAVAHSGVWPTPIPLFVLGCGLGYLKWRTRSLVAPITLHALFNSVSTILMLTGLSE